MGVTCLRKSNLNKKSVKEATEVDPLSWAHALLVPLRDKLEKLAKAKESVSEIRMLLALFED